MTSSIGPQFVGNTLRLSALGCGMTGLLLLPVYPVVGMVLCAVAIADLGLFWLLRARSPGIEAGAG